MDNNCSQNEQMKKTNIRKMILDLVMAVALTALMKVAFTGLLWHEIIGLVLVILFVYHIFLNKKCTWGLLKKIFSPILKPRSRALILLDILLGLLALGLGLTGILISGELFTIPLDPADRLLLATLHGLLGYGLFLTVAVHIGFHWKSMMAGIRKMSGLPPLKIVGQKVLQIFSLILVLLGIRGSIMTFPEIPELDGLNAPKEEGQEGAGYVETAAAPASQEGPYQTASFIPAGDDVDEEEDEEDFHLDETDDDHEEEDDEDDDDVAAAPASPAAVAPNAPSLQEYLSKLYCTGCSKHCPLSAPSCGTGAAQAREAQKDYEATYAITATAPAAPSQPAATDPSLEEYLSKLFCTGCSRHCPLSAPACGTGVAQAREAQKDYEATYGVSGQTGAGEPAATTGTPTLEEYLSKLHCTLCPNNCPLTAPGCGRGEEVAAQAKAAYYEEYGLEELAAEDPALKDLIQGYLPMMGGVVAGTHYILLIPEALKKRKE